ncbi:MAG: hypothetical protein H0X13_16535 [Ramlibacter sp.]|nr:hypothetical protein [Ramlibacter sp.]
MSDNQNFGFGKFVPGFDFLQGLAKGASIPQMPSLSNWVAPTLNVEELEKRIGELKAVHFWLDQNSKALGATIQALEVQKMTLATLKGMNFNMSEMAEALKLKAGDVLVPGAPQAAEPEPATEGKAAAKKATKAETPAGGVVDPLQWWSALTQQFQEIAATAMKDGAAAPSGGSPERKPAPAKKRTARKK